MIQKFHKDNNSYSDKDVLVIVKSCIVYCERLFELFLDYIQSYFLLNSHLHTKGRIYNPHSFMQFNTKEDACIMRNLNAGIAFVELKKENLNKDYKVLLVLDDGDKVTMYNSDYKIIAIRDQETKNYIGILKPIDNKQYALDDGRLVEYRKYKCITKDYEFELNKEMYKGEYSYRPFLSELEITHNI